MSTGKLATHACLRRVILALSVWLLALPSWLQAASTPVRLEITMPDGAESGGLRWGVMRGGLEMGRGEERIDGPPRSGAGRSITINATLAVALPAEPPAPVAHACIDRDDWHSYIPSFGDRFQAVPLQQAGDVWTATLPRNGWQQRTASDARHVLTVHYHRFEQDYEDASLWTWDEYLARAPKDNELYPVGEDDFGLVFQLDTGLYGKPGEKVGLLPRLRANWDFKDGPDRFWSPQMPQEVYLVQGDTELRASKPDVRPKLVAAGLDGDQLITVRFSHRLPADDWPAAKFKLTTTDGASVGIKQVEPLHPTKGRATTYAITTVEPVDFVRRRYQVEAKEVGRVEVRPGRILHDPDRFYDRDVRLGATYAADKTSFRVFAPTAAGVKVVVGDEVEGGAGLAEHDMESIGKGVWQATVSGDLNGKYYAYKLSGVGLDGQAEVVDIHAACTQGRRSRSLIVDLAKTDPPGFREHRFAGVGSAADAIVYEVHVRDFSISRDSGIQHKGKFLGLTEAGTHLPGEPSIKTGLDHLVELGVTHVQLMPIQDFDNDETRQDQYDWGYMPVGFNSPDGWYATSVIGPARIRECKQMIQALHERGIGVIMDVVYNHTAGLASFERTVPGYYFRMTPAGRFSNGSGCGNEFQSESPMARKFILDSVRYWAREYKVDGFRFDLMGLIDLETMKQIKEELAELHPGMLVYGEAWAGGRTPLSPTTGKREVRGTGIGAFNDQFRDAIKGDRDGPVPGFIQVGERRDGVITGLEGAIHDWTIAPTDTINYFEAHDDLTTWDKLLASTPQTSDKMRARMMRLATLTLMTSQGLVFTHSGQEFCRTKKGSPNSYNLPDEVNQIDWMLAKKNRDVYEYHRGLIAFRKAHALLRLRTRQQVESRISFPDPPHDKCVVCRLDGAGLDGETAREMLVLLNGHAQGVTFELSEGTWSIHADADRASPEPLGQAVASVRLPAHSGMLLVR